MNEKMHANIREITGLQKDSHTFEIHEETSKRTLFDVEIRTFYWENLMFHAVSSLLKITMHK